MSFSGPGTSKWTFLGSKGARGAPKGTPRGSRRPRKRRWRAQEASKAPQTPPRQCDSPSGVHFGPILGPLWGVLLGPPWVHFRVEILGRFRGPFRARSGSDLGPILAPILGPEGVQKWSKNGARKRDASQEGKWTKNHSKGSLRHLKNVKNQMVL